MKSELEPDVCIMQTTPKYDYLIRLGETLQISQLRSRVLFCPSIMDEPELQIMAQCFNESKIASVTRNHAGYWWSFNNENS